LAKVDKGWLKTREGNGFAPNTLAESIYTREGKLYKDEITN
jgi:hypothetical protein